MIRRLGAAAALGLLLAAGTARAQETGGGGYRSGRLDLGIYAGGATTSRWFDSRTVTLNGTPAGMDNDDAVAYKPGLGGAFGAFATYWMSPVLGVRAHGNYTPMRVPFASDGFFDVSGDGAGDAHRYVLNGWFYDLDLMLRPFARRESGAFRSLYLWAGGGGFTVDVTGPDVAQCEVGLLALGACLSGEPKQATVGQGTGGVGMDLLWLGHSLALFSELGAHVYDSPVHVGDDWVGPVTGLRGTTVAVADDKVAVTTRLVVGLKLVLGDIVPRMEMPVVLPPPPPPPPMEVTPPPPPPAMQDVNVCVVQGGQLTTVMGQYNPMSNDTTVNGAPFSTAYPTNDAYAANATWYVNSEPITFNGRRYVKYGLPRVLSTTEVTSVGTNSGVGVFAESSANAQRPDVIYVPVRPGCEFQPYQYEVKTGGVRG